MRNRISAHVFYTICLVSLLLTGCSQDIGPDFGSICINCDNFSFSLQTNPQNIGTEQGGYAVSIISMTRLSGNDVSHTINLSVSNCPAAATCIFENSINETTTTRLLIYTTTSTPIGTYVITINGKHLYGTEVEALASTTVTTSVSASSTTLNFSKTSVPLGIAPNAIVAADFNGDSKQDIAVIDSNSNTLTLLLGNGTGGFPVVKNFATGSRPVFLAATDLNKDGFADLIVSNASSNTLSVYMGEATNGLGSKSDFPVGQTGALPWYMSTADFNNDGYIDIAVLNLGVDYRWQISIMLGDGTGTLTPAQDYDTEVTTDSFSVGDINGDSIPDLTYANTGGGSYVYPLYTLYGDGHGGFTGPFYNSALAVNTISLCVSNFNTDSAQDVVVNTESPLDFKIYLGNGDGTYQLHAHPEIPFRAVQFLLSDIDYDGYTDIVTANASARSVTVISGDGNGGFKNIKSFAVDTTPNSIAIADFNGDGKPDIAAAQYSADNISVLIQQ